MLRLSAALLLVVAFCPHARAQTFGQGGAGEGAGDPSVAATDAARPGAPYLDLRVQKGESEHDTEPLTRALYAQLGRDWRTKVDLLIEDPEVQALVQRAATAHGRVRPVEVVLSATARTSYFHRPRIVIGSRYVRQDADREQVAASFENTLLHELAHCLQYRLYGQWLPRVDYTSTEFVGTDSNSHTAYKVTNESTAWCEGFAEAVAAHLGEDPRIEEFRFRKVIYWGVRDPRDLSELARIEGWAACLLHDFWAPKKSLTRLDRSLGVIALSDRRQASTERHERVLDQVKEHVLRHPEDAVRWELVLQANTFLRGSLGRRLPSDRAGLRARLEQVDAALQQVAARYGQVRTAKATWLYLMEGTDAGSLGEVQARVLAHARTLQDSRDPLFEIPGTDAGDLASMPIAKLEQQVRDAEQEFRGLMQTYGYDFHPRVKEAKQRWQALEAALARRR